MAGEGLAGLAFPLPGRRKDFSRGTLRAGRAVPTRWKAVDAVFPFEVAPPSTPCVPAEHWDPTLPAISPPAAACHRGQPAWATPGGGSALAAAPEAGSKF